MSRCSRRCDVHPLAEVALDEALHIRGPIRTLIAAEDLHVNRGKVVIGIGVKLALEFSEGLCCDHVALCVGVG